MNCKRPLFGHAAIILVGICLIGAVRLVASHDYATARENYVQRARSEGKATARRVEASLRAIYENLRTITFLPTVQNIDRHGSNLSAEGRATIQQIYNNLASNVSVSEVYIVPADLDPDKIDPITAKPEEPILMFDQLIVHAGSRFNAGRPTRGQAPVDEPEEVETFEYHQLHEQFKFLRRKFSDISSIEGLSVPVVSGPEIITCDNTQFIRSRVDQDRSGVLFSVPFYGPDDKLKGSVTAIILSNALRKLLPEQNAALVNTGYHYVSRASANGQERLSSRWVVQGAPDPNLIYSDVLPLGINDPQSGWAVWLGNPDSQFYDGAEASAVRWFEYGGYGVVGLLSLAGLACWTLIGRNIGLVRAASSTLETRVAERTAQIRHMATHDALTGLPNRLLMREKLEESLARIHRDDAIALLCLDLDHFKSVNDTLGHPVGDLLLKQVTARLRDGLREIDTVARLGGDEFVVIQLGIEKPEEAGALARRLIDAISEPFDLDGHRVVIGVSIGVTVSPDDGEDADALLKNADMALYRAKSDGRNTCRFFEPAMDARMQERRRLEVDLRRALVANEFVLHYQPQVEAASGNVTGFEALVRWNHPQRGLVPPSEFIPLAEEIGVIVPLGAWVLRKACADAATWPKNVRVAVNLSPAQFKSQALAHTVISALGDSGLSPFRLEIEITESVLLADSASTLTTLHQLRTLGISIAMDDFGTGYSSLSYLRSFPFNKIKIDRSFVQELSDTHDCVAIVKAVASLGISLGMTTTAEGVETEAQLDIVRAQGCTEIQGYYYSRPRPAEEVEAMLYQAAPKAA